MSACDVHSRDECPLCVDDGETPVSFDELLDQNSYLRKRCEMQSKAIESFDGLRTELSDAREEIERLKLENRKLRMGGTVIDNPPSDETDEPQ